MISPPAARLGSNVPRSGRIVSAAAQLLAARGMRRMTIADVADAACVGKGTVYLHWRSKEELVLDVLAQEFLTVVDACCYRLESDPRGAQPSQLCVRLVRAAARSALLRHAQDRDRRVLGELANDARTASLVRHLGPHALAGLLVPVWRRHGAANTAWAEGSQSMALGALLDGMIRLMSEVPSSAVAGVECVTTDSVIALLKPVDGEGPAIGRLAEEVSTLLGVLKASFGLTGLTAGQ